jgi:hypothetical protein
VYACPSGPLAGQLDTYFAASRARFGPNLAHAYPPHITLTGFFHDDLAALPTYLGALGAAHAVALANPPVAPVAVTELATSADFHGLLISSPWLEALTADFALRAPSSSRRDALRLKNRLHLSLAYGFRREDGPGLAVLARSLVDINASVHWRLRLYERLAGGAWQIHGEWGL